MGKGQSKSYDISSGNQKASHRPKSAKQRESLILAKEGQINGDSQNKKPVDTVIEEKPVGNEKGNNSLENKKPEINGTAENTNLESVEEQNKVIEKTNNSVVTENTEDNNSEEVETKSEPKEESDTPSSEPEDNNQKEESDKLDQALEDYIQTHQSEESEPKGEVIQEKKEVTNKAEVEPTELTEDKEPSDQEEETTHSDKEEITQTETKEVVVQEGEVTQSTEDNQEASIDLGAEEESDQEVIKDNKTVEEEDAVQFKTVISLETTPSGGEGSPKEGETRDSVQIIESTPETAPLSEPGVPVEEPTLPESASVVSSEIPEEMPTVEAVVCGADELKDGEMREVEVGEGKALLVRENGQYYAVGSKCTHYGAPLAKGALCNGRVRCPWHGACFNVKTGDIEDFPGLDSLPKFDVTVANGKVKVKGDKSQLTSSKVQRPMCKRSPSNKESVLIIGGGPASLECAETLRREGFTGQVTIATQENCLPYDRIKLSKAMTSTPESIALRKEEFYTESGIDIQKNKRATSVDTSAKSVKFQDGSSLSYTSLVIATGGKPRQLPIPGANFDNVCLLRTPDDANKIAEAAKGKKVVIIGSSFIGMEVAASLSDKAESLSVVDIIKVPFQMVLGEKVGSVLQKMHEEKGVKFFFEKGIKEFTGENNKATTAVLSDDTKVPCDLAVLGVGVVPATDFLKDSGINMTNRGFIPVDKNMKTNIDGVYAAGDIVEFPLFTAGDQQVNVQHWQMAHAHGKAAALGILNKKEEIKSVPFFWTMMYGKSIRYTGYGFGFDDIVVHGDLDAPSFVAFYTKGDNVVAVATLGADPLAAQVAEIMYSGQKILKSEIMSSSDVVAEKFSKLSL